MGRLSGVARRAKPEVARREDISQCNGEVAEWPKAAVC